MTLKVYSFLIALCFVNIAFSQYTFSGKVLSVETRKPIENTEVYSIKTEKKAVTDALGNFTFTDLKKGANTFIVYAFEYEVLEETLILESDTNRQFFLKPLGETLSEVVLMAQREKRFALQRLNKVEGTAIYAGKKTEVVEMANLVANFAANNARQIYNQVAGLNIYDSGNAGIQLNIGGRGLNPNRTQNFNTRQNGYGISADELGYPESYYTPPAEALSAIQIVRGAASLQYGTQFGGMINFKFREPPKAKKIEIVSRQTGGSYGLFTSFNSLGGTLGKFSYYVFYNHKQGSGFQPNSRYNSDNAYIHLAWQFSSKTDVQLEYTFLNYLAQQPGGLWDAQFYKNPSYSNRPRNWFAVNWNLYALKFRHRFSETANFSLNIFGLDAYRVALGFRENRVSQADDPEFPREMLRDNFNNWGAEARFLKNYELGKQTSVFLIGARYYKASNYQRQGPGSAKQQADFKFADQEFPYYERQSEFNFPNTNAAFFGENIFKLTRKLSLTPGFRVEYIKTESMGSYKYIILDQADNVMLNQNMPESRQLERYFALLGIGAEFAASQKNEVYANFSQNYRSVTYNDIRVINPSFQLAPNIADEKGFNADLGLRSVATDRLSYDVNVFGLMYNNRIGEILREGTDASGKPTGRVVRYRGNIGDAFIYGLESLVDWNIKNTFFETLTNHRLNIFANTTLTDSRYLSSQMTAVKGKKVEFVPFLNFKTGIVYGFKNVLGSFQYTYLSSQFSDATNASQNVNDSQRGIEGSIPGYGVADVSFSYKYKWSQIQTGINNLFNSSYFTQRATGYPGPGIIPAQPITWYVTLGIKF